MQGFWIGFGIGTHLLVAVTVVRLVPLLAGTRWPQGGMLSQLGGELDGFWVDVFLALQFCVVRHILLSPGLRSRLRSAIPAGRYGAVFRAASCVSLLWTIEVWQPSRGLIWQLQGFAAVAISAAQMLSAVALVSSISRRRFGFPALAGRMSWWDRVRIRLRTNQARSFVTRSVYRLSRRPGSVGSLGLVWFTPVMSLDRATLAAVWTVSILLGGCLQSRWMMHDLGARFREDQGRVPEFASEGRGLSGK